MGDYESSSEPWLGKAFARFWLWTLVCLFVAAIGVSLYQAGMLLIVLGTLAFSAITIWAVFKI